MVCEYDGLIHGWAYIWNAVSVSNGQTALHSLSIAMYECHFHR